MVVDHRLLHGMQAAVGRRHSFDGPDGLPVDLRHEKDAGVHRAGLRPAVLQTGHNNRAGAAVSFVAALLRSGEHSGFPQPFEQSERRVRIGYVDLLVVESELYTRHVSSSRSLARFDRESMRTMTRRVHGKTPAESFSGLPLCHRPPTVLLRSPANG